MIALKFFRPVRCLWSLLAGASLAVAQVPAGNEAAAGIAITPRDNYEQWKDALPAGPDGLPVTFDLRPGFEIEMLRAARPEEDSWIALTFDAQGRFIIAKEKQGLLRLTPGADGFKAETIDDTLRQARGIQYAAGAIFANVTLSPNGLYRLRDTTGDDRLDEIKLLVTSRNRGGHGRNGLTIAPDGSVAMIHGDSVELPPDVTLRRLTPPLVPGLLPADDRAHGHLMLTNPEGTQWTLVASGMRNPVGVDYNADGEPFTYDADAEFDMGTPWYRPTHVRHLVSGADFGWRLTTGNWPPYYPDQIDNPPVTLPTGKGSPTAVRFGTRSHFPPEYQRALYIMDWSYGRIIAVHLTPEGASYTARAETFVRGRPLNVTGLEFGPDGAMYFVTGGRATQSALYRVRYTAPKSPPPPASTAESARLAGATAARALRRSLEQFHGRQDSRAVDAAWRHVDHADPWIAHAARVALEHQRPAEWAGRALEEGAVAKALPVLMALTRVGPDEYLSRVAERLTRLPAGGLTLEQQRIFIRTAGFALQRMGGLDSRVRETLIARLEAIFPHATSREVNWEASRLLLQLEAPGAVARTSVLLAAATQQEEKLHYLQLLGRARSGWTAENRGRYFRALAQVSSFRGGAGLPKYIRDIETEALAALPDAERSTYAALLQTKAQSAAPIVQSAESRPFVRSWKMADLEGSLGQAGRGRDFQRGKNLFSVAACAACHQLGLEGQAVGPDLTDVASRFSRRDLLDSILEPSRVVSETYRTTVVTTKQGETVSGRLALADFRQPVLRLAVDPLDPAKVVEISKNDIVSYEESELSPMPPGLLDRLKQEEILDLLAYIEAGGDPQHPNFRR